MLGIALAAIVLGCLLMILTFSRYSFSTKVSGLSASSHGATVVQAERGHTVDPRGEGLLFRVG
jgi:hypothetical protein